MPSVTERSRPKNLLLRARIILHIAGYWSAARHPALASAAGIRLGPRLEPERPHLLPPPLGCETQEQLHHVIKVYAAIAVEVKVELVILH